MLLFAALIFVDNNRYTVFTQSTHLTGKLNAVFDSGGDGGLEREGVAVISPGDGDDSVFGLVRAFCPAQTADMRSNGEGRSAAAVIFINGRSKTEHVAH